VVLERHVSEWTPLGALWSKSTADGTDGRHWIHNFTD